jgi:beta-xylosidase
MVPIKDRFVMYFSAMNPSMHKSHCIGVAVSKMAAGPYKSAQEPLICVSGRDVIDPAPFLDDNGALYLAWKLGGQMKKFHPEIYLTRLSPDGLRLVGGNIPLITNDQAWEGINVEAPYLLKRGGTYYLFYSGNLFQTVRYGVGYAVSRTITGPYVKSPSNPILSSSVQAGYGPGEETVFRDVCGSDWLGFSDYDDPNVMGALGKRHFHAMHLSWTPNLRDCADQSVHIDWDRDFSICQVRHN